MGLSVKEEICLIGGAVVFFKGTAGLRSRSRIVEEAQKLQLLHAVVAQRAEAPHLFAGVRAAGNRFQLLVGELSALLHDVLLILFHG